MTKKRNILQSLANLPLVKRLVDWSKQSSLPGFDDIPLYDVIIFISKEIKRDGIVTRANSMAFSFFIALFPTIIFLFTLLPIMPFSDDYLATFEQSIRGVLPQNAEEYLLNMIRDIMSIPRGGLLSFGFILAIYFASNGMQSMLKGFQKSYESTYIKGGFLRNQLVGIQLIFILVVLFIASVVMIILGRQIFNLVFEALNLNEWSKFNFKLLRWLIVSILLYSSIALIYRYGPAMKKKFKFFTPGATLATLLSILVSIGFAYFVNNFGTYNKIYGSIGALIVIMLWMQMNSFILLAGYELNASIAVNRDLKALREEEEKNEES